MKTRYLNPFRHILALLFFLLVKLVCPAQGRVVINEYMPWTLNGCGATSEFIELLNFGPGPVNIGCYILTDGDFSITIPPNTILQPGEFYVISGQDSIAYTCANIDSAVHSDLNWNTCNCTSGSIPTTGDGFLTDGGTANEQVVLLDPALKVLDAVARSLPVEISSSITTSTIGGQCTSQTFDLDLMSINYETIGESAGRGNSFARRLDGDCGWVKDPQQSANATNNTPGDVSSVSYSLTYTEVLACPKGSIVISVNASSYTDIFPMHYTLGFDSDSDGVFEMTDQYTTGTDSTASTIPLNDLVKGNYSITLASDKGCNLHTINFTILDCFTLLALHLFSFEAIQHPDKIECKWSLDNAWLLGHTDIEISTNGFSFQKAAVITTHDTTSGRKDFRYFLSNYPPVKIFLRIAFYDKNDNAQLSKVIVLNNDKGLSCRLWPNPVHNDLKIEVATDKSSLVNYQVFNNDNRLLANGIWHIYQGINMETIPVSRLPKGNYRLLITPVNSTSPATLLGFIKL